MTPLQTEISTGPLAAELAPFVVEKNVASMLGILNDKRFLSPVARVVTDRTILAECINPTSGLPDAVWANSILDKLDAAAAQSTLITRAMKRIYGDGLDIGDTATQSQISLLVPAVLTDAEASALLALGKAKIGRAKIALGEDTSAAEIVNEMGW